MSWSSRVRELIDYEGLTEAEAYAVVGQERLEAEAEREPTDQDREAAGQLPLAPDCWHGEEAA